MTDASFPLGLTPEQWRPHPLHGETRIWPEKNCFVDLWIGLLHAHRLQPLAALGGTVCIDHLGDQWTFYKPSLADLRRLYGIEVQELTVWRALHDHVREHLAAGRLVSVEADAWWLPDTAATDYRQQHTKTTIVIVKDEPELERLTYLHNAGLFSLSGEDYRQTLSNGALPLPLYAEWIDARRRHALPDDELRRLARDRLSEHLQWIPRDNPVRRFAARYRDDLAVLAGSDNMHSLANYHRWAFAGTRQLGASMELLALHLKWLGGHDEAGEHAIAAAQHAKTLLLKGARAAATGRAPQVDELMDACAQSWDALMKALRCTHRFD